MASVGVWVEGSIIHAYYTGTMTMEVVQDGERQIEALLDSVPSPVVLYDTVEMDPPTVRLAMEMKSFDKRIASRIRRSATVVKDATTAFCAKLAFVFTPEHRVFYNDVKAAREWLSDGAALASA